MKTKFYLLFLSALTAATFAQAKTLNTAITNGANWSTASAGSQSRIPASGDSIVIPAGITIWLDIQSTLSNVQLTIGGTLEVDKHSGLALDNTSVMSILSGGMVTTTHNSSTSVISIGGTNKYVGNTDVTVAGPATASSSTGTSPAGFAVTPVSLPVTFVSFSGVRSGSEGVTLTWSTANERDNSHFEVERSLNGTDWTTIGTVAAGASALENSYGFTDADAGSTEVWYRLNQVDLDGHSMYSKIVLVGNATTAKATIVAIGKSINILFGQPTNSKVTVRLISMGGQVLNQETIEAASSTMNIGASNLPSGIYVVYLTDGKGWATAQKVML